MTAGNALARAGLLVSAAFLASRVLGYLRVTITTAIFGAGPELDAFFAAFRIPDLMFQLVAAGAMGSALVPIVAGLRATGESERGFRIGATVLNLVLIALGGLALVFAILAPVIVPAITPGFDPATGQLAIDLTRIMLASPVLLALGAVSASLLNASGRFLSAAIAPIAYNAAIIAAALLFGRSNGVTALAYGVVAGSALHFLIQLPTLWRAAFRPRLSIEVSDPLARKVFWLMAPRALGLASVQLTFLVNTTLASSLGAGAITAYTVAFTLLQLPIGTIAQPLGIVALPTMSRAAATGAHGELRSLVERSLRLLAFALLIVAGIGIVLRTEIVRLLFGYGRFDDAAVDAAAGALGIFLLGLPAHGLIAVLARAFYADQDTRTPVVGAMLAVGINIAVSVLSASALGIRGLALGIAIGAWVEATFLLLRLAAKLPGLQPLRQVIAWLRFGALAAGGAAVCWFVLGGLHAWFGDPFVSKPLLAVAGIVAGGVAAIAYVGAAIVLGEPEPATIRRLLLGALRRSAPA
jgi:putative peptidoglycan lipid II flippase